MDVRVETWRSSTGNNSVYLIHTKNNIDHFFTYANRYKTFTRYDCKCKNIVNCTAMILLRNDNAVYLKGEHFCQCLESKYRQPKGTCLVSVVEDMDNYDNLEVLENDDPIKELGELVDNNEDIVNIEELDEKQNLSSEELVDSKVNKIKKEEEVDTIVNEIDDEKKIGTVLEVSGDINVRMNDSKDVTRLFKFENESDGEESKLDWEENSKYLTIDEEEKEELEYDWKQCVVGLNVEVVCEKCNKDIIIPMGVSKTSHSWMRVNEYLCEAQCTNPKCRKQVNPISMKKVYFLNCSMKFDGFTSSGIKLKGSRNYNHQENPGEFSEGSQFQWKYLKFCVTSNDEGYIL